MRQNPLVQSLAVGTMAVCMVMLGAAVLIWLNARGVAESWGVEVPLTVYLVDHASDGDAKALAERVSRLPEVAAVEHIEPDLALERLQQGLGGDESLLAGLEADTFPHSLEVHLRPEAPPDFGMALAARLEERPVVEEAAVLGPWARKLQDLLATLRLLALAVGALVSLACMAIVWSTIRLGVFARRAEIQILSLVGGTARFVRAPFVFEGFVQGSLGAALALGILAAGFDLAHPLLEEGLSLAFAASAIHFFSPLQLFVAVAFGGALGVFGSRLAVARYIEA
jgi:cell division transport system permease protein